MSIKCSNIFSNLTLYAFLNEWNFQKYIWVNEKQPIYVSDVAVNSEKLLELWYQFYYLDRTCILTENFKKFSISSIQQIDKFLYITNPVRCLRAISFQVVV